MQELTTVSAAAVSNATDVEDALDDVLGQVAPVMCGNTDLAVVFFSAEFREDASLIASTIHDALAPAHLIGTSAVGVLANDLELESGPGISLFAISLPNVVIRRLTERDLDWPASEHDPERLRQVLDPDGTLRGIIMLADPFGPLTRIVPALSKAAQKPDSPIPVPIIGGVASAARQAGENRVLNHDELRTGGIVCVTLSGPLRVDTIVSQGCRPIGEPMIVTGARHNIIEGLAGKSALKVFSDLVRGMTEAERKQLELGMFMGVVIDEYKERFGRGDFLIRNVVGVDQKRGFLAVSDLVRVGQTVQFHVRDARTATEDLELLLAARQLDGQPLGGLLFTCNGRGQNMFPSAHHDVTTIRRAFPDMPLAGCFAAGEIGPIADCSFLHGFTASMALFRSVD